MRQRKAWGPGTGKPLDEWPQKRHDWEEAVKAKAAESPRPLTVDELAKILWPEGEAK